MKSLRNNFSLILSATLVGFGVFFILLCLLSFGNEFVSIISGWQHRTFSSLAPEINRRAPDFNLDSLDGKSIRLSSLQGKVLVINFWASWCDPCRQEMSLLQEYADRYPTDMTVLAVNDGEAATTVHDFVEKHKLKFPVLLDPGKLVIDAYRVRALPTTLFVDATGALRFEHMGTLNDEQFSGYLRRIGVEK